MLLILAVPASPAGARSSGGHARMGERHPDQAMRMIFGELIFGPPGRCPGRTGITKEAMFARVQPDPTVVATFDLARPDALK